MTKSSKHGFDKQPGGMYNKTLAYICITKTAYAQELIYSTFATAWIWVENADSNREISNFSVWLTMVTCEL